MDFYSVKCKILAEDYMSVGCFEYKPDLIQAVMDEIGVSREEATFIVDEVLNRNKRQSLVDECDEVQTFAYRIRTLLNMRGEDK